MKNRVSIIVAAVLGALSACPAAWAQAPASGDAPAVAAPADNGTPAHPMQAVQDDQGVIVLSNRRAEGAEAAGEPSKPALNAEPPSAATPAPLPEEARAPEAASAPAAATESSGALADGSLPTKNSRKYLVIELAVVGVLLIGLVVFALVRIRRRRTRPAAVPPPLDLSARHIVLSRDMPREAPSEDAVESLPEAPPPASIRTPITPPPASTSEGRIITSPASRPGNRPPASKPQDSDLAAALLRATVPPPPSQRQWLSQRPSKDPNS
jgi:hypothetical protein